MRRVLLVDDSVVVRHVLARRLAAEGFSVHEAHSPAAARQADPRALACAIIDLELAQGDGDGAELAGGLLRLRSSLPVAFFTSGARAELVARARKHGPIFEKPEVEPVIAWAKRSSQPPPTK